MERVSKAIDEGNIYLTLWAEKYEWNRTVQSAKALCVIVDEKHRICESLFFQFTVNVIRIVENGGSRVV